MIIARPHGWIENLNRKLTDPLARYLEKINWITPNGITWASFIVAGILAPIAISFGFYMISALVIWVGDLLDHLDGDLARIRGCASKEGEILDAVLDRYVDFLLIAAILWQIPECLLIGFLALLGSQMVPYIRARSEAVGKAAATSFGTREVRNLILVIGLLLGWLCILLIILAIISNASAIHRFVYALKKSA